MKGKWKKNIGNFEKKVVLTNNIIQGECFKKERSCLPLLFGRLPRLFF